LSWRLSFLAGELQKPQFLKGWRRCHDVYK
jgi:hypothetical protein